MVSIQIPFPRERYELIRNSLEVEFKKSGLINFVESTKADVRDIYLAHDEGLC